MRFVVDDAPWAPDDVAVGLLEEALVGLTERLEVAAARSEAVEVYEGLLWMQIVGADTLYSLLYEADNPRSLPHDLRLALGRRLDKCASFDELGLPSVDAVIDGVNHTSPAAVRAHGRIGERAATACLTPATSGRRDEAQVVVAGVPRAVRYVVDEPSHVAFFRDAFAVENADEESFASLAPHAFPELEFADGLWGGLRDFSRPYRDRRDELVTMLGALSDHGRRIFGLPQRDWIAHFAAVRIEISPESSSDMKPPCLRHRQRELRGETLTFEWHMKLDRHVDRVHVHPGTARADGRPVVGILTRHLPLSSRGEC